MVSYVLRMAVGLAVVLSMGLGAYKTRSLDLKGSISGVVLGLLLIFLGGLYPFIAMAVFVFTGFLATRYGHEYKRSRGLSHDDEIRGAGNVWGNGLPAVIFLVVEAFVHRDAFWAATFASIATVTGDTLASEFGKVFGRSPVMITTLKPAVPGTNGAVSVQGEIFAILGTLLIAPLALPLTSHRLLAFISVVIGGFIGVNLDSLIGATLENRGITNNDSTNFLAAILGGLSGAAVFLAMNGSF